MAVKAEPMQVITRRTINAVETPTARLTILLRLPCRELTAGTATWVLAMVNELGIEFEMFMRPMCATTVSMASASG